MSLPKLQTSAPEKKPSAPEKKPRNFVCKRCGAVRATGGFYTPWACPAARGAQCEEAATEANEERAS